MLGNGKVFISHTHEDNPLCQPLIQALEAWGVDYWYDAERMRAGNDLTVAMQQAITERDIFLRVCTPAAQRSYWMRMEIGAFRGLQSEDAKNGRDGHRTVINLVLAEGYSPEPFDFATIFLDATRQPEEQWLATLRRALKLPPKPSQPLALPQTPQSAAGAEAGLTQTGTENDRPTAVAHSETRPVPSRLSRRALSLGLTAVIVASAGLAMVAHAGAGMSSTPPLTQATKTVPATATFTPSPTPRPTWKSSTMPVSVVQQTGWKVSTNTSTLFALDYPTSAGSVTLRIQPATGQYSGLSPVELVSADPAAYYLQVNSDQNMTGGNSTSQTTISGTTWEKNLFTISNSGNTPSNNDTNTSQATIMSATSATTGTKYVVTVTATFSVLSAGQTSTAIDNILQGIILS